MRQEDGVCAGAGLSRVYSGTELWLLSVLGQHSQLRPGCHGPPALSHTAASGLSKRDSRKPEGKTEARGRAVIPQGSGRRVARVGAGLSKVTMPHGVSSDVSPAQGLLLQGPGPGRERCPKDIPTGTRGDERRRLQCGAGRDERVRRPVEQRWQRLKRQSQRQPQPRTAPASDTKERWVREQPRDQTHPESRLECLSNKGSHTAPVPAAPALRGKAGLHAHR